MNRYMSRVAEEVPFHQSSSPPSRGVPVSLTTAQPSLLMSPYSQCASRSIKVEQFRFVGPNVSKVRIVPNRFPVG